MTNTGAAPAANVTLTQTLPVTGAAGTATPTLFVPNLPFLAGWQLYFAAFTLDASGTAEHALTNWIRVTLAL